MGKKVKRYSFVFIDEYYQGFLHSFRKENPNLSQKPYSFQKKVLLDHFFGTADFYSYNLKRLGYQAEDLIVNDPILQGRWAFENGVSFKEESIYSKIQMLPLLHKILGRPKWIQEITLAQVKEMQPDIVYIHNLSILNADTLKEIKGNCKILVGQIATSLPAKKNILQFDLILTSFPHYVKLFRSMGIKSEYLKIAFDNRVLEKVGKQKKIYDVTFIGSFSPHHTKGTKILEDLSKKIPVNIWGQGIQFLSPKSPLRKNYHGGAWGIDMYKILAQSKIVVNRHISASRSYANNMRLYESTGMGALLITDKKKNLNEIFKVGEEVIEYNGLDDLIKKVTYYLSHADERDKIALNGQRRTLKEHTYQKRMKQLIALVDKYIKNESR